mgnify:CR=1 FL=1
MKRVFIFVFGLFLLLTGSVCFAQEAVRITKPVLELKENRLEILYDILNSTSEDKFRIWVEITDSEGNRIDAKQLSGDIGESVSGGRNKMIAWDLQDGSAYLDNGVYVEVHAEVLSPAEEDKPVKHISRGATIIQSLAFPGWGLSRINKGKPHWLKGVAGYGCLAASIVYNKKAVASYEDYKNSTNVNEIDTFYENSVMEDKLSEGLAYAAIGIWVVDFIWTIAGSSKLKDQEEKEAGFSINTVYEPHVNVPVLAIRYNF